MPLKCTDRAKFCYIKLCILTGDIFRPYKVHRPEPVDIMHNAQNIRSERSFINIQSAQVG